jgi:hypothetical protein
VTVVLPAPAVAAPAGLPTADRMREALLTLDELPYGLVAGEAGQGSGDSDFVAWDRCSGADAPENSVEYVHAMFAGGKGEDGVVIAMMIGATGADHGPAVVKSVAEEVDECWELMDPLAIPAYGDASTGAVSAPALGESQWYAAVIAEGDVLAYLTVDGLDRPAFTGIAETFAGKLEQNFATPA